MNLSLTCPDLDAEQIYSLGQRLCIDLSDKGISSKQIRPSNVSDEKEYRGDPITIGSLAIAIAQKIHVVEMIGSLKSIFAGAPKSLTATITTNGRSFTFTAANLGSDQTEELIKLLQRQM